MDIYTPQPAGIENNPFVNAYTIGERVQIKYRDKVYDMEVRGFPRNGAHDTDHRIQFKPLSHGLLGYFTVSSENNWYGQKHLSEVEIIKL